MARRVLDIAGVRNQFWAMPANPDDLTNEQVDLLKAVAAAPAQYTVEDVPDGSDDRRVSQDVIEGARVADELVAAGLAEDVGHHLEDGGPGVYRLLSLTDAGRAAAAKLA